MGLMIFIFISLAYLHANGQLKKTIHGKVLTHGTEKPLEGASVTIKSTNSQVKTSPDGLFTINAPEGAVLEISFVGFAPQQISVGAALPPMLIVSLQPLKNELQEVEIASTGYQQLPKERATGSFSVINKQLIERRVGTDLISRLEDGSAGLAFNRNAKTSSSFNVRGQNTMYASSRPLIVIDNFPYDGDLSSINPNDVESVTLLKDAAAASIWGASASNGVLVITTKKGRLNTAPKIDFNSNYTIGAKLDLFYRSKITTSDFIELEQQLFSRGFYKNMETAAAKTALSPVVEMLIRHRDGKINAEEMNRQISVFKSQDLRAQQADFLERKSIARQLSVALTGGSKSQTYFLSAGYDNNLSNAVGNGYERFTFNGQNTYQLNEKLEVNIGLNFSRSITDNNAPAFFSPYPYGTLQDQQGNPAAINRYMRATFIKEANERGLLNWEYKPLEELDLADNQSKLSDYRITAGMKYKVVKGLSFHTLYNYTGSKKLNRNHQSEGSYVARDLINKFTEIKSDGTFVRAIPMGGILDQDINISNAQSLRTQLNYAAEFAKNHQVTAIAGAEIREIVAESTRTRIYGYQEEYGKGAVVDYLNRYKQFQNPSSSAVIPNVDNMETVTDRYLSYYVNAAYSYRQLYTASFSARLDQSNLFGVKANQKGVPLYSVGAGWNISSEEYYHIDWLPYLKLRTTYGHNGNTSRLFSASLIASLLNGTASPIRQPYAAITNPPNPELRWEKVKMFNIGLDFASKSKIVSGSIEYYTKRSTDLLGANPAPYSTGIQIFRGNVANTKGTGLDLTLNSVLLDRKLKWEATALLSITHDEVTKYQPLSIGNGFLNGSLSPTVGRPLYGISSYAWAGLDPETGDPMGYLNGELSKNYAKIIANATVDNVIFNGSAIPTCYGSLRNTFSYGSFSLSVLMSYRLGYYYHRESVVYGTNFGLGLSSGGLGTHGDYGKRWRQPGDEGHTQVPSAPSTIISGRDDFYTYANVLTEKGDHIRLQDVRLTYDLQGRTGKLPFSKLSIYGYANNLGLLWQANKSGIDPDFQLNRLPVTVSLGFKAEF